MSAIDLLLLLIDIAVIHSGYAADEVVPVMEERAGGLLAHREGSASHSERKGKLLRAVSGAVTSSD